MNRLLVTGLDGFVGGWVRRILEPAWEVMPLADAEGARIDITQAATVAEAVERIKPNGVLHLAAQSHVPTSVADPVGTFQVNALGTLHLLRALDGHGFSGCFLLVSSGDVYGAVPESDLQISEVRPPAPRNPYAASKVAAEALAMQCAASQSRFRVVIARAFNHIGPGQSDRFAVADFARQIVRMTRVGGGELITGDIDATRDFTDVRDVVAAYGRLLTGGQHGGVYNVCSGAERSLRDVIDRMVDWAGVRCVVRQDSARLRPNQQRRSRGDPRKIQADTGWHPTFSFDQSLCDILTYWKDTDSP